ncbi:MAG: hypothetical protein SCL54_10200 [Bacillota bacterium]|nr:hypothetical protein [Bacillota bacterium]
MNNIVMTYLFNDLSGRIVFKPYDVFEEYAKSDKPDYVRYTR